MSDVVGLLKVGTRYKVIKAAGSFKVDDVISIVVDTKIPIQDTYTLINWKDEGNDVYRYIFDFEAAALMEGIEVEKIETNPINPTEPTYEIIK